MKKHIAFVIVIISLLTAMQAVSQGLPIRDVHGRLQEKTSFEPTRISVEDNRYVGIDPIEYPDTILLRNCAAILRKDLDFSPYFEIILLDSFFMRHMELTEMTMLGWRRLGSEYLVKMELKKLQFWEC